MLCFKKEKHLVLHDFNLQIVEEYTEPPGSSERRCTEARELTTHAFAQVSIPWTCFECLNTLSMLCCIIILHYVLHFECQHIGLPTWHCMCPAVLLLMFVKCCLHAICIQHFTLTPAS